MTPLDQGGATGARDASPVRSRLVVTGVVQGVGFRPFIHRLANRLGLRGWVLNSTEGVVIEVEGDAAQVDSFTKAIPADAPARAMVERVERTPLPPIGYTSFSIEESQESEGQFVLISPDICICDDCLRELRDPSDRRYRYPFVNCTNCGPRFSIVSDVPYDRPKTTMACFTMCPECGREYHDPSDRRFHAQPNACPVCGPVAWLARSPVWGESEGPARVSRHLATRAVRQEPAQGLGVGGWGLGDRDAVRQEPHPPGTHGVPGADSYLAVQDAARLLVSGSIVAVKGLGGFHLACDATNDAAVEELRRRKRRSDKPFAIMAPDTATVAGFCHLSDGERQLLESPQRPIVLLQRKENSAISSLVAPNNRFLGVMLPYTPLHHLLFDGVMGRGDGERGGRGEKDAGTRGHGDAGRGPGYPKWEGEAPAEPRPGPPTPNPQPLTPNSHSSLITHHSLQALVMTSGNLSEEPIATGNREALDRLSGLADAFLLHDRDIKVRCDDSVTRLFRGREAVLRRSRGYAPFPVRLGLKLRDILACGGELKSTFCMTKGDYAFLSQHIGDLENAETLESYVDSVEHFRRLFRLDVEAVAHDLHPEYLSTRYAWELAGHDPSIRLIPVQHHHAHVASCMAENGVDEPVIGVSFDGTGYGEDGCLWGGEFLVSDFSSYRRAAHLKYVPLPGGEAAIKRPYRMAVSYLLDSIGPEIMEADLAPLRRVEEVEMPILVRQASGRLNAPLTSSAGRLFDAVSSLVGLRQVVNYEGQAAIELEMAADPAAEGRYGWAVSGESPMVIDMGPTIRGVVDDLRLGTPAGAISARFHNTVAEMIAATCRSLREETGISTVALSGGVFQNLLLLEGSLVLLERDGFRVLIHHQVPTNDGGLSLGQAAIANRVMSDE